MDDPVTVELELPRNLLGALRSSEHELEPELQRLIALGLFREECISSGKAAELLGISKARFIDLLDQHGIAIRSWGVGRSESQSSWISSVSSRSYRFRNSSGRCSQTNILESALLQRCVLWESDLDIA